ncbi:MAG: ATP-binding cassette domain-containing protein [Deltaproteobacteria bacterium]|nr:ATP-binding cassette domain-containing protein [Deltaproteobacteria bacterium]
MNELILTLESLIVGYYQTPLSQAISASVRTGARVGVMGPNGAGKSTFIKTLLGILRPVRGNFHWLRSVRLGYVPQERNFDPLFPLTVQDYLQMGSLKRVEALGEKEVEAILQQFDLLALRYQLVRSLSGGQRQRALIARALVSQPSVLLLDEAWNSLDANFKSYLEENLFQSTQDRGLTYFLVEHDLSRLKRLRVEQIFLFSQDGVWIGNLEELLANPKLVELSGD